MSPPQSSSIDVISFADNAVILFFYIIAASFYTHILYCYYFKRNRLKTGKLASSLLIFLWTHLICVISDMPNHTYIVVKWSPANQENYDPYVLYWTSMSNGIYYNLTCFSVLLLSLDRLLILRFFLQYKKKNLERWFPRVTILFLLGYSIFVIVDYLMKLPLEKDKLTKSTILANLRFMTIITNVLISAYFLWTFRTVIKKEKVNMRVVKMTIALEIALNAFPYLMLKLLPNEVIFVLMKAGPLLLPVLNTANVAFSAAYTWFILVKRSKESVISVVSVTQMNHE